jgi:hypothetical protein
VYGEIGEATVHETVQRIAAAKNVRLHEDCLVLWPFRLRQLSLSPHHAGLRRSLAASKIEVVFLDSHYISRLLAAGHEASVANLYEIWHELGPLLLGTAQACLAAGTTPFLVHHRGKTFRTTAKNAAEAPPPELIHLSAANIEEFARQWLFVYRRIRYQPGSGTHRLTLGAGGSAEQAGYWNVDVDEGIPGENFKGGEWNVQVRPYLGD